MSVLGLRKRSVRRISCGSKYIGGKSMGLKEAVELLSIDLAAEIIGTCFVIGVLVWFVHGGAGELLDLWGTAVCG